MIRPLPLKYRRKQAGVQLQSGSRDDEMFMDEEDFRSSDFMSLQPDTDRSSASSASSDIPLADDAENLIQKRKRSVGPDHSIGSHVIYKRAALQSESDYGK